MQSEQKWLTSIQILTQPPRQKLNSKHFAILPGVFLMLNFCEKGKDPIYEIQFNMKPGSQWAYVKTPENIQTLLGSYLCFKTQINLQSGPISDIDLLNIQRKSRFGQSKQIINVPHGYKLVSYQLPFGYLIYRKVKSKIQQSFKAVLSQKYLSAKADRINLTQLPLFCFPEGIKIVRQIRGFLTFNFIFTLETAQRIFVTCLVFKQSLDEQKRQKLQAIQDQLFYEKALCILTNQCFTDQFGECLQHLYRLSMSKSEIPFWRVAQSFVNQMIMPQPTQIGEIGLTYCYGGNKISLSTNKRYSLVSQRALYSVFKFMCVENIISVFESLLLERKVFFVSQSKTILGYATQAFLGLLYPFKWEQVLIPILPSNLKQYLTAPVPLIAGITPSLVDSTIETDSVIVYLDKNEVLNDEDNPPLPQKLLKQLTKRLQKLQIYDPDEVNEFLQNPQSTYLFKMQEVQDPQFHGHLVRDIFFEFILTFMKNYKKFLSKPKLPKQQADSSMIQFQEPALISNIFKVQDFLSDLGMTKVGSFGYKLTESSIFTSFIERRYLNYHDPELLFFDECIQRKKSKKQTSFIVPITNKQYRMIKNPEIDPSDNGPFFYNQFPSLLKQPSLKESQIKIQIAVNKEEQQQNKLMAIIQQQYQLNNDFFQKIEWQQQIHKKMLTLLLNKNKPKLNVTNEMTKIQTMNWFIALYQKQMLEIQMILNEWPEVACEQNFKTITKYQFLKCQKPQNDLIIGVQDCQDYQILYRKQIKLVFMGPGMNTSFLHKSSTIFVEVSCYRIKHFINKVIKKQAGFLLDFCEKQAAKDMRASAFRKTSEQIWTIETIIAFKNWLHYEKQFATRETHEDLKFAK